MKQLKGLRKLEQIEVTGTQVSHPPGKPSEKQD